LHRFLIAAALTLIAAAPASAAWETPQRVDTQGEDRGDTAMAEIAAGANGLVTIFFLQGTDSGDVPFYRRRSATDTGWSVAAPVTLERVQGEDEGDPDIPGDAQPELEANDAGTAGVTLRARRDRNDPDPNPTNENRRVVTVFGGGWVADPVAIPSALRQLIEPPNAGGVDKNTPATGDAPDVDVDGSGIGHAAAVVDPPSSSGPPPSDPAAQIRYVQFDPATATPNAGTRKADFVKRIGPEEPEAGDPYEPASRPRLDVNENGDVALSFVSRVSPRQLEEGQRPDKTAVYVARKLKGQNWNGPVQVSHEGETDNVTEHDVAIAPDGTLTVLFAASPEGGNNKLYARRWLGSAGGIRPVTELVSSSDPSRPAASAPRAVAHDDGNVTAAWREGGTQLLAAQRTSNWNLPQALSTTAGAFDVAVDEQGTGTIVYLEGSALRSRRRATGTQWGDEDTVSSAATRSAPAPRVDARNADQADAIFVQANGALDSAYAARFTGAPPVTPVAPPKPDTEDCPGDINVIAGDAGANVLTGTAERDSMLGGDGDDTMFGQGGDDCLRAGAGNDQAHGGGGNDSIAGGDGDDRVTGDEGADTLAGGAGTDSVNGDDGDDAATGGDGGDTVDGSDGKDLLSGEGGDDRVRGGAGDDGAGGADGADRVFGGTGVDVLYGGIGDDRLSGGGDDDTLLGEDGDDRLLGGAGADSLQGAAGDDKLRGGAGQGTLDGGDGEDGIRGGSQTDRLTGGLGADTLFGLAGSDVLLGGASADKAYGGSGTDRLSGNAARDRLRGGTGADRLSGGAAGDRLFGDGGKDRIAGGGGNDRIFAVDDKRDRINCGAGRRDRVVADRVDRVSRTCERVRRRT
jgi:Ca2+-binding RTX toxin-like protein